MPTPSAADPRSPIAGDATRERPADRHSLPDAAVRALAEAAARRTESGKAEPKKPEGTHENGGRGGLDPTRYGDWEVNGLASDF